MPKDYIQAIPLTRFNTAGLAAGYLPINPAGVPEACSFIKIHNDSNVDVTVSFDGITDHIYLPQGYEEWVPTQWVARPPNYVSLLKNGTIVYVAGPAAGIGFIYLSGFYQN